MNDLQLKPHHMNYLEILYKEGVLGEIRDHILNQCKHSIFSTKEHEKVQRDQAYFQGVGAIRFYQLIKSIFDKLEDNK